MNSRQKRPLKSDPRGKPFPCLGLSFLASKRKGLCLMAPLAVRCRSPRSPAEPLSFTKPPGSTHHAYSQLVQLSQGQ